MPVNYESTNCASVASLFCVNKLSRILIDDMIDKRAKHFCNDPENKRIKLKHTQRLGLEYEFADKEAIDCVIEAIKQHKNSMPMILKDIYERVIIDLEAKKKELKESS
jgi:hypothetical protein